MRIGQYHMQQLTGAHGLQLRARQQDRLRTQQAAGIETTRGMPELAARTRAVMTGPVG